MDARRWSWQWVLAVLIALTPLLTAAPEWAAQLTPAASAQVRTPSSPTPRSPPAAVINITVDGEPLPSLGTDDDGVVLAPVGSLVDALGGSVVQPRPSQAQISLGGHTVSAQATQATINVDGTPEAVAVPPVVVEGELYVPVRALASVMGYAMNWLGDAATLAISTQPALPVPSAAPQRLSPPPVAADQRPSVRSAPVIPYTQSDLELMARVIHGEAGGQPLLARIGVGAVIVNRVRTPGYPKTVAGVIYAPGQFQAVGAPMFEAGPVAMDLQAARDALYGDDPTGGALYFYVPAMTDPSSWIFHTRTLVTLGVIRFSTK